MYARITPYKMKPGSKAAATNIMDALREKIMDIPGQQSFMNVLNDETGEGYVVSTTENEVTSPETAEMIKNLWGAFSDYIVEPPVPATYDLVANWEK